MSIHKIKNGYRTRWREAGRQCSKNFRLKSEAVQFLAETKAGTKNVVSLPLARTSGTGMTFSEFAPMWFRKYSSVHKAPSTQIRDHQSNRDYFMPAFGHRMLSEVTTSDAAELQSTLKAEGRLSNKSINNIIGEVRKMFEEAVKWQCIAVNPFRLIEPLAVIDHEYQYWTIDERDHLGLGCSLFVPFEDRGL